MAATAATVAAARGGGAWRGADPVSASERPSRNASFGLSVRVRRKKKLLRPSLEKEIVGAERTRMMMPIMDVNVQHTPPAHIAPRHALRRQGSTLRRGGAPAGGGAERKKRGANEESWSGGQGLIRGSISRARMREAAARDKAEWRAQP